MPPVVHPLARKEEPMRRSLLVVSVAAVAVLVIAGSVLAAPPRNFTAPLTGAEEVVDEGAGIVGIDTRARGVAIFQLSPDGSELSYRLIASNIENVLMAHIHCCGGPGENEGIVVWLYPEGGSAPQLISGRHAGTLETGTITADDLVGVLADGTLGDLVEQIAAGQAYVNVHTTQFPGGEIRGQLP
jgi:hypothetical protein